MPIREFSDGEHITEKLLIGEADRLDAIECPVCGKQARRIEISLTGYRRDHTVLGDEHAE